MNFNKSTTSSTDTNWASRLYNLITDLLTRFHPPPLPNVKSDLSYCKHTNRRTHWYHLVNIYGNISLVYPTKASNYDPIALKEMAGAIRKLRTKRANDHNISMCRRCRSVVFNCSGCAELTLYFDCHHRNSSVYCSRNCFETHH